MPPRGKIDIVTEETAEFLLSESGRALIDQARAETDPARGVMRLRKIETRERVAGAFEIVDGRRRGTVKFGELAGSMYFTTEALEQASSAGASAYHARRMVEAGITDIVDICGGIGADALAFARAGLRVTMFEIDPARARFAEENARVTGMSDRIAVRCVDATSTVREIRGTGETAVWFDPARRLESRRVSDPEDYRPPLSFIDALRGAGFRSIGVKLSPAIDHEIAARCGAELEFLSDQGECKEALLWMGRLERGAGTLATVIRNGEVSTLSANTPDFEATTVADGSQNYLYEPDPAVIRAHLVQALGERIGAGTIDPRIAYLIGPAWVRTPFAAAYAIVDRFPFHVKALNRTLREHNVGRVVIKKRGFPQEPEEVRKQLKLTGSEEMTIVLTRVGNQHQVILCRPAAPL